MARIVFSRSNVNYVGTDQADQIYALGGHNIIDGGKGADLIFGAGGGDLIFGGDGMDRLVGKSGFDQLDGGRGDDILEGNDGADQLSGTLSRDEDGVRGSAGGHDILRGGSGSDIIDGLDDHVYGDNGNDQISSGAGFGSTANTRTFLYGNAGSDQFLLNANANGHRDIVEVMDFKRGDQTVNIYDGQDRQAGINGLTGEAFNDQYSDPLSVFNPQRVGHDVVFTTNVDHDQIIIHNADWIHI